MNYLNLNKFKRASIPLWFCFTLFVPAISYQTISGEDSGYELFSKFCFDCHDDSTQEGNVNLQEALQKKDQARLENIFENLITQKMPPDDADQPEAKTRQTMLRWLAERQKKQTEPPRRRISRNEFNHSLNDLLKIELDLTETIPDDRGTNHFDSSNNILLTKEMLSIYFDRTEKMLDYAFPSNGFAPITTWKTNKLRDSHQTYNIYHRPYRDGTLFSWTRANNGNSYSFFYDDFSPPEDGWYELSFDAAKVGNFNEDIAIQVHAGKYYFADDRPQPQRLVDVISLSDTKVKTFVVRGFFRVGESVSVHCISHHTWRKRNTKEGAYIKEVRIRGPLRTQWPPTSYSRHFRGLELKVPQRRSLSASKAGSNLESIGGSLTVSSFQKGMEKEKMLDGSNRTFWHTRFSPTLAKPPHFVIIENPSRTPITGLHYSTWSGGNGNGQVKAYKIFASDLQGNWGDAIHEGKLETRLAAEQPIVFAKPSSKKYFKFLITDSYTIDGRSLASIGKLDVLLREDLSSNKNQQLPRQTIVVDGGTVAKLRSSIKSFAESAFSTTLTEKELSAFLTPATESLKAGEDFVQAAKTGFKAVLCSPRFLVTPGVHENRSFAKAAFLAHALWQSVPDERLLDLARNNGLDGPVLREQIHRMIDDPKSARMIKSLCNQWLNLRSFKKVSPSLKLFPRYDDLLDHYLPLETEAFLQHLVLENQSVGHLIDSPFTFLNQRLARHYGIDNVYGQHLRKIELPEDSTRGGLLTMGSILKVTTDGFATSPILRGAWVSKNIAGNPLSPPPESVQAIESDTTGTHSIREQIEKHKNNAACSACHKKIDPYGFALESFDAAGQWRDHYQTLLPHRGTFQYRREGYFTRAGKVDTAAKIDGETITNIREFKRAMLLNHKPIAYNFMKKFFEYANGHPPDLRQRIQLFHTVPDRLNQCGLRDLIVEVLIQSLTGQQTQSLDQPLRSQPIPNNIPR